jgi:hypothetical protein
MIDRKEVKSMQSNVHLALALAREFQEREIERAASERRFSAARQSIRRSFGRRVIAVGERIAAEQSLELARSR